MAKILILEDSDERIKRFELALSEHSVTICKAVATAIGELYDNEFDYVFIDYDLGEGNDTGDGLAKYLSENYHDEDIALHTMNPEGAKIMRGLLPLAKWIPFSILIERLEYEARKVKFQQEKHRMILDYEKKRLAE